MIKKLYYFSHLMRMDKPIGVLLLLWPTLWGLWIASEGQPKALVLFVFLSGVFLMRSAGCVLNDFTDRNIDPHVERTKQRPMAAGKVSKLEAIVLFISLSVLAFSLVLTMNALTIQLSFFGLVFVVIYPFMKRITHLPQFILGIAFSWGIPMAFAAETGQIPATAWLLFTAALIWPAIYDTMYAMADREDDLMIGVKSTAILFGSADRLIILYMQILFFTLLILFGIILHLNFWYFSGLALAGLFSLYQQYLIRNREPQECFRAFLNNNYVGLSIFLGLLLNYAK